MNLLQTMIAARLSGAEGSGSGGGGGSGGAISPTAKAMLLELFQNAYFRNEYDPSAAIAILSDALETSEDNKWYITNHLTNCSTSNENVSVRKGTAFTTVITPDEGYSITQSNATLTVQMGGEDITSTAWDESTKTISIETVTGDIIITAIAVEKNIEYKLYQPAAATKILSFGTRYRSHQVKKIELTMDYPDQGTSVKAFLNGFAGGWIGFKDGNFSGGGMENATSDHTADEIIGKGKVTLTFTATTLSPESSTREIILGWSDGNSLNAEVTWYRIRFFDVNDVVLRDAKPTSTVGQWADSVVGDTLSISDTTGYVVSEVE